MGQLTIVKPALTPNMCCRSNNKRVDLHKIVELVSIVMHLRQNQQVPPIANLVRMAGLLLQQERQIVPMSTSTEMILGWTLLV